MFIEKSPHYHKNNGFIEVICGSMFSGKTEELIRRIKRAQIANQKVQLFKPEIDKRYAEEDVVSHNKNALEAIPINNSSQILLYLSDVDVVGIDEAQFFDNNLPDVCNNLANRGIRVIIAGLDMDFKGKPFEPMPQLLAVADFITKVHAICIECGTLAQFSYRISSEDKQVLLGEKDEYAPLCRSCYLKAQKNVPKTKT